MRFRSRSYLLLPVLLLAGSCTGEAISEDISASTSSGPGINLVEVNLSLTSNVSTPVSIGDTVNFVATMRNIGGTATDPSIDLTTQYYLVSTNLTPVKQVTLSRFTYQGGIGAGADLTDGSDSFVVPAGLPDGIYFLRGCADINASVTETNTLDNCSRTSNTFTVSSRDLTETIVTPPSGSFTLGQSVSITETVNNLGGTGAGSSTTRFVLSLNGTGIAANTVTLGTRAVGPILGHGTSTATTSLKIPAGTPSNTYRILVCSDSQSQVVESKEGNNCTATGPTQTITITGADYIVTALSVTPQVLFQSAQLKLDTPTLVVTDTTRNNGTADVAVQSYTRYFVSGLDHFVTGDSSTFLLKLTCGRQADQGRVVPGLNAHTSSTGVPDITTAGGPCYSVIGSNSRLFIPVGTYHLIACADRANVITETSEANNCTTGLGSPTFQVVCASGFQWDGESACVDINECDTNNGGCDLSAGCTNTPGGFSCGSCPVGTRDINSDGSVCESSCDFNSPDTGGFGLAGFGGCDPLQACTDNPGTGVSCGACPDGYDQANDGSCVSKCAGINADPNGGCDPLTTCTLAGDGESVTCGACPDGYSGNGSKGCVDINECESGNNQKQQVAYQGAVRTVSTGPCDPLTVCANTIGSYTCGDCPSGYATSRPDGIDSVCTDIDECVAGTDNCDALAGCTNTVGGFSCGNCPAGFSGDGTTADGGCQDIDECTLGTDACDPQSPCTNNTAGGYTCGSCPAGFDTISGGTAEFPTTTCVNINECQEAIDNGTFACDPLTQCDDTVGSFTCSACPADYTGDGKTGCIETDECLDPNNGGCDVLTTCIDNDTSFSCSACPDGYGGTGLSGCFPVFVAQCVPYSVNVGVATAIPLATVTFTDTSNVSAANVDTSVDFGDGGLSSPSHVTLNESVYTVSATHAHTYTATGTFTLTTLLSDTVTADSTPDLNVTCPITVCAAGTADGVGGCTRGGT